MAVDIPAKALPSRAVAKRVTRQTQTILVLSKVWSWVFLGLMLVFFSIEGTGFFSVRNSQNILVNIVPVLLMGLGQTFVIIAAGIDLSVGWVMGLASVVSAIVMRDLTKDGLSIELVIPIGFAAGIGSAALAGLINGLVIAKLKVTAFIVTLGVSFVARGAAYLLSGGNVVGEQPVGVRQLGNESLIYLLRGGHTRVVFFKKPQVTGEQLRMLDRILPWPVIITFVLVFIAMFILHKTQFGRHTYALGGNKEATVRAGVPVDRLTILLYIMSAVTTGFAGCLYTARFSGGSAIAGDPLLLSSIAAVIIGGVSMFGGEGRVSGTVLGALVIAVLQTGLIMMNVEPFYQYIVVGIIVILAVLMDQARDLIIGRAEAG
jgi:ribose/xylose/arabinose/galactoside ABC-type transport system permease subunit